ncbi:hypothetical protein K7432_003369 [Basidiobolus ranarum]|uniref:DUF4385 domain containing protein n=1 Tax=Basidiobolus ranarum TaxID=34480 RepID=A0ABR2W6B7_9FUNG
MPNAPFDYNLPYTTLNLREAPHLYHIGIGEQGVLLVEPYKSELLPLWRFRTPDIARESSQSLQAKFEEYKKVGDFIGMDMARKFIQMGVTRSRRYANHKGGRKYRKAKEGEVIMGKGKRAKEGKIELPRDTEDPVKAESARIFGEVLKLVKDDKTYQELTKKHRDMYETGPGVEDSSTKQENGVKKRKVAQKAVFKQSNAKVPLRRSPRGKR